MSLMNGLSSMGKSVSDYAGAVGLEQQKAELDEQRLRLADSLTGARESAGRQESGQIAATAADKQQTFLAGQSTLADQRLAARESAGRQEAAQLAAAAPSPEIKSAKQFAALNPDEKRAYREEMMTKAGLPPWMIGDDTTGGPTPPSSDTKATDDKPAITGEAAPSRPGLNEDALKKLPPAAASLVKGMVEGRINPPSSFAASKPYWQNLIQMATTYDPTFDETTWAGRIATKKDFASGQSAKAVTAMNTALAHAGTLMEDFDKLGNYGGIGTPLNAPFNAMNRAFGDSRQTKAQQTIDALASEARKVFAASGGGNLTELQEWQKSFPVDGSPEQQKAALTGFVELLDGRLHSLADQYNRGMGKTDDPVNLLQPAARAVYERLTGREPKEATGYQTGKAPDSAAEPTKNSTAGPRAIAPSDPAAREVGKAYPLPNGKTGVWRGNGWEVTP